MALIDTIARLAADHSLDAVGVARAEVLDRARRELVARKAAGLADSMQFTYKNPVRSTDPFAAVRGARSVIVAARSYQQPEPSAPPGPVARVARYAWDDHYGPLREGLWAIAGALRAEGYRAVAYADDNTVVDREVAYRAGIGWFGKNANILIPGRGSWFVLGCVITDAELPASTAPAADGCGPCRRCLDGCPTGAIVAPGVIDARRCLAWLVQKPVRFPPSSAGAGQPDLRVRRLSGRLPGEPPSGPQPAASTSDGDTGAEAWVPVVELLGLADDDILARHGRWYLHDRDPRWIRRNALIVLGNTADGTDPAVAQTVSRYLAHADPMLRAHAVWAARQVGLSGLLPDTDPDPSVRAELGLP